MTYPDLYPTPLEQIAAFLVLVLIATTLMVVIPIITKAMNRLMAIMKGWSMSNIMFYASMILALVICASVREITGIILVGLCLLLVITLDVIDQLSKRKRYRRS